MADLSLLDCGDLTGTPAGVYVSDLAAVTTSGVNYGIDAGLSAIQSIVIGGIEYQSIVFWGPSGSAVIKIRANRGSWKKWNLRGSRGTPTITCTDITDAHFAITHGVDPAGYVHISYNNHDTAIKYRISLTTIDAFDGTFSAEGPLTGVAEDEVTYVRFLRDPANLHLYCFHRHDNSSADSRYYLKQYNHTGTPAWVSPAGLTDGLLYNGVTGSYVPYNITPIFTPDWDGAGTGYFFMSWVQRTDQNDSNDYEKVCCVFWDGTTWMRSDGTTQTIPITFANAEVLANVAPQTGLYRGSSCGDSQGRIHNYYTVTTDGTAVTTHPTINIYHQWWNPATGVWTTTLTSNTTGIWGAAIVTSDDGVCTIFGKDYIDDKLKKITSDANDFSTWAVADMTATTITDLIFCPNYDARAWAERNELIFMVPYTVTKPFLLNGLVAHYDLQDLIESSALLNGGSTLLTNVNTVTFAAGKIGNAANFENSAGEGQQLTRADDATLSITGDMTIGVWVNRESTGADRGVYGKWEGTGNQRSYALNYQNSTSRYQFFVSGDGTGNTPVLANNFGAGATGVFESVLTKHDATNNLIGIKVDDGPEDTAAHSTNIFDGTGLFRIARANSPTATNFMDGLVDELAVWNRLLNSTETAAWHNAGNGRPYFEFGMIAPLIWSHGSTATTSVDAGNTAVATIAAWGNLPMSEALTGTDAADFNVTDNGDGTWALAFDAPATAGSYEVILTLTNDAGSDSVTFTVNVAGGAGLLLANAAYFARQM